MSLDPQKMGTLLQRMTGSPDTNEVKFTDSQVNAMIEIFIPRFVTSAPGMPKGMKCNVERTEKGWTIHVEKPHVKSKQR